MSTNSDRLRRTTYKSPFGPGAFIWRGDLLVAHELPGTSTIVAASSTVPTPAASPPSPTPAASPARAPDTLHATVEKNLVRMLENYFVGKKTDFDLAAIPLDRSSWTPFQARVTAALAAIPYGTTISYTELARAVGHPRACRAVGNFMAANPYPVIIACHRVVKSDGSLGNYSAGIDWKIRLLRLEGLPFPGMG